MDNFAVPGSNGDDENLFDFEAVSSTGPWAGTHNDDAPSTAADYRGVVMHMLPITETEQEAILAVRALNAQHRHQIMA